MAVLLRGLRAPLLAARQQTRSTTILCVRRGNDTVLSRPPLLRLVATTALDAACFSPQVIMGDGQVSMGNMVAKPNARKVRRLGADGKVLAGIAGTF